MKTNRIAMVAAAVAGLFATQASASTLTLVGPDASRGSYITFEFNGAQKSGFAGALQFSVDGTLVETYCVDVTTSVNYGPYQATALPPASVLTNAGQVAYLFSTFAGSVNDVTAGTALQLAIWDALYDGGDGLSNGLLQASSSLISQTILNQAQSFITSSIGQSSTNAVVWQSVLGAKDAQMQIGKVPEPSSVVLLGSGLALAAWRLRRKKQVCA